MRAAALAGEHDYWTAAGLLYVHGAIAYADAVTIRRTGTKSASDKHMDVLNLIKEAAASGKGLDQAIGHLRRLIEEKNRAAYTGQSFRAADIEKLATHAERFEAWARLAVRGEGERA
jgi:hypothetical protein